MNIDLAVVDSNNNPMIVNEYYNSPDNTVTNLKYLGQKHDNTNLMVFQTPNNNKINRLIDQGKPIRILYLDSNGNTMNSDNYYTYMGLNRLKYIHQHPYQTNIMVFKTANNVRIGFLYDNLDRPIQEILTEENDTDDEDNDYDEDFGGGSISNQLKKRRKSRKSRKSKKLKKRKTKRSKKQKTK